MSFGVSGISRLMAVLLCLCVVACDKEPVPQVRCATGSWAPFDLLFVGERQGYVDPDQIHLIESPWTVDNIQAVRSDSVDAVGVSLLRAVKWAAEGVDLTVVLVTDDAAGADVIIAKPDIKTFKDLKGKTVAVDLDTVSGYFLLRALEMNDMTTSDINIVNMQSNADGPTTYANADAVVSYADDAYQIIREGGHLLLDSHALPGELLDTFVVNTSYLKAHPDRVAELVRSWLRARALFTSKSEPERWALARQAVNPDDFMKTIESLKLTTPDENDLLLSNKGLALRSTIAKNRDFLIKVGAIAADSPWPKVSESPFNAAMTKGLKL